LSAIDAFDRRLFERLTREERRLVDISLKRLSNAANRSLLWVAIAGLIAVLGGRNERRAALRGIVSIGITSTLVNLPLKYLARRDRPPTRRGGRRRKQAVDPGGESARGTQGKARSGPTSDLRQRATSGGRDPGGRSCAPTRPVAPERLAATDRCRGRRRRNRWRGRECGHRN